ncbi:hypothetical protein [Johnsonella ignava]|mgnify:CR=1 FL=1|uniref:hypothetical protein n=1 Tax=Johnsonella ignava TaxID=43995 RepID=UPI0023F061EA|nr:hypothetical protein [Johnsonella ignava]
MKFLNLLKNKFVILGIVFIVALVSYFIMLVQKGTKGGPVYTSIEEPSLPVVWVEMAQRHMNCMRGFLNDPGPDVAYDTLTSVPEDSRLKLFIRDGSITITGIKYEIRSADLSELIDRGSINDFANSENENGIDFELPIGNYLSEWRQYRLDLTLVTENKGDVHYYTAIMKCQQEELIKMVELAASFSDRNFDYDAARENATYLESDDTGDNTNLGLVNLKSSYEQLTYRKLNLRPVGVKDIRLCSYDGYMGELKITFSAGSKNDNKQAELYEISESFIMRVGPERLYMMDYTRTMSEVFLGDTQLFNAEKIELGINGAGKISGLSSPDERFRAFVSNRDLILIDRGTADESGTKTVINPSAVKLYSFRSGVDSGLRSAYDRNDIKILKTGDNGSVDFLVYGYINRGKHEGETGIIYNRYDPQKNIIVENFFIPINKTYGEIREDVLTLAYLGGNNNLYMKIGSVVYSIDPEGGSSIVVAEGLRDGCYSISPLESRFAWQVKQDRDGSGIINFMNFDTGTKQEIKAEQGKLLSTKGFIDSDLVLAISDENISWIINDKKTVTPYNAIEIINDLLEVQEHYERVGNFISDVRVEGGRVHLKLLNKNGDTSFNFIADDTIVSNTDIVSDDIKGIGYYSSEDKGRVFFTESDFVNGEKIKKLEVPENISYETTKNIDIDQNEQEYRYNAYVHGDMVSSHENPTRAIQVAYAGMGRVNIRGNIFYARAAVLGYKMLKVPATRAEDFMQARMDDTLTSLMGISLRQSFYFLNKNLYVLGYSDGGAPLLIYGYDRNSVYVYDINAGDTKKIPLNQAEIMFNGSYNDFSCFWE